MSKLVETDCKRCGKPVVTLTTSNYGCDELKEKYGGICGSCITPEEKNEMLMEMGRQIVNNIRRDR